jgi:hypothetical protein
MLALSLMSYRPKVERVTGIEPAKTRVETWHLTIEETPAETSPSRLARQRNWSPDSDSNRDAHAKKRTLQEQDAAVALLRAKGSRSGSFSKQYWKGREGSNLHPPEPKSGVLPIELHPHIQPAGLKLIE